jgi:Ca2+-transporting ATPase
VLCCDKTGTLTENRMAVAEIWTDGAWHAASDVQGPACTLLDTAALACEPQPFDPMERAILATRAAGDGISGASDVAAPGEALEKRYPFGEGFLAICHGWRMPDRSALLAMKGAPETVLALCDLADDARQSALAEAAAAARRGLRVLGVARAEWQGPRWPDVPHAARFAFLGFVALADPVRPAVPAAVGLAREAGIRVVMVTGDHPETALAIARQAGIGADAALTGAELAAMSAEGLAEAVRCVTVFARVRPEQKLALVNAYRAAGEVVAMTGDGVNDAPALKAAHIGIAMGRRGTDVAREAAALVLLDDDFTSIVGTVRLGRRIYDNIRNAMRYLLAVHVPLAGMALLAPLLGWPLFATPVHVVFLEFVIDPACSIVFEAERSDPRAMQRPPRPPGERLFTRAAVLQGFGLGAALLLVVALIYHLDLAAGRPEGSARAMAFVALVAGNLGLILVNRSARLTSWESLSHANPALWWIAGGTLAALAAAVYVPSAASVFRFQALGAGEALSALAAGVASVLWFDVTKIVARLR